MKHHFSNSSQINTVSNFSELINLHFHGEVNAVCWHRNLTGDFKEIVTKLHLIENITEVSTQDLLALQLTEQGQFAREIILEDMQRLTDFGGTPILNLLKNYEGLLLKHLFFDANLKSEKIHK